MMEMPPKPPRFPPGLISWDTAWVVGGNLSALALNAYISHLNASRGYYWMLFLTCTGMCLSLWALSIFVQRVTRSLREWEGLMRAWHELDAFMKEREKRDE